MEVILRKKHPKGFWVIFRSLDLNTLLKKRDRDWFNIDRDFCVYLWKDPYSRVKYIGMGRYTDEKWYESRAFKHKGDMLINTINEHWTCEILCYGCSSKEAHIIEAYLIKMYDGNFSKRGQYVWDGESLINKRREKKYERKSEEYLNLDGNNNWEALIREINYN